MQRRLFVGSWCAWAVACMAALPGGWSAAEGHVNMRLVPVRVLIGNEAAPRFLLLHASDETGARTVEMLDIGELPPTPVGFVVQRDCTIEGFDILDVDLRTVASGIVLDGAERSPVIAQGQSALIWGLPGPGRLNE